MISIINTGNIFVLTHHLTGTSPQLHCTPRVIIVLTTGAINQTGVRFMMIIILISFSISHALGFSRLNAEDQIGLLKGSVVELGLLRNSHSYNQKKGDIDLSMVAEDTGKSRIQFLQEKG